MAVVNPVWVVGLPPGAEVLVKKGQKVKRGDNLAVFKEEVKKVIPFPAWIPHSPRWEKRGKHQGETLVPGEVIYQDRFLWKKRKWSSRWQGKILLVDVKKRQLVILLKKKKKFLKAPAAGEVLAAGRGKIKIRFSAEQFLGKEGEGKSVWGEIFVLRKDFTGITKMVKGRIVFTQKASSLLAVKAKVLGARGIVAFRKGAEKLSLPFLLFSPKRGIKEELKKREGRVCLLDPVNKQLLVCLSGEEEI